MQTQSTKLSNEEVRAQLLQIPDWKVERGELESTFSLPGFPQAIFFVNTIAHIAESEQNYPEITVSGDQVTLRIATHAAGGITGKDFTLARRISEVWQV